MRRRITHGEILIRGRVHYMGRITSVLLLMTVDATYCRRSLWIASSIPHCHLCSFVTKPGTTTLQPITGQCRNLARILLLMTFNAAYCHRSPWIVSLIPHCHLCSFVDQGRHDHTPGNKWPMPRITMPNIMRILCSLLFSTTPLHCHKNG